MYSKGQCSQIKRHVPVANEGVCVCGSFFRIGSGDVCFKAFLAPGLKPLPDQLICIAREQFLGLDRISGFLETTEGCFKAFLAPGLKPLPQRFIFITHKQFFGLGRTTLSWKMFWLRTRWSECVCIWKLIRRWHQTSEVICVFNLSDARVKKCGHSSLFQYGQMQYSQLTGSLLFRYEEGQYCQLTWHASVCLCVSVYVYKERKYTVDNRRSV